MIYFDNVSKTYDDLADGTENKVLDGLNLSISPGEFVSIVGHSGAGKTSFIKILLGEEKPTEGAVFYQSTNIHTLKQGELVDYRRKIGVVFQDFRLLPNRTAYENIAFAMEAAGREEEEIANDVPHVLELVDLQNKMHSFPHQLSGGEMQRVAIARAIINRPEVIIADEPTGNLDPINTYDIIQILKKINDLGTTIILTTHNKGIIDNLQKRVITMEDGKIIRDDKMGRYFI